MKLTYEARINAVASYFVFALCIAMGMTWHVDSSIAGVRAVAEGSGTGGGGPGANCTGNGGVVYASAGGFVCNTSFTTDGGGNVSASAKVTANTLQVTSATTPATFGAAVSVAGNITPTITNTDSLGTNSLEWLNVAAQNITSNGTLHFLAQNASTDGATVTNNLWSFGGTTTYAGNMLPTITATDGIGSPSLAWAGLFIASSGALVESVTSGGANVFAVGQGLSGTIAGSPYIQVGTGAGNSTGIICGTVSNGLGGCWSTAVAGGPSASNYGIAFQNTTTQINANTNITLGIGGSTTATITSTALSVGSGISLTNSTGVASFGSITANNNGITPSAGALNSYVTATVASGGSAVSSGSVGNITTVTLPSGNWLVTAVCNMELQSTTAAAIQSCSISNTNSSMLTQAGVASGGMTIGTEALSSEMVTTTALGGTQTIPVPSVYVQVAGSLTAGGKLYVNCAPTYTAGKINCYGTISAMRQMFMLPMISLEMFAGLIVLFRRLKGKIMRNLLLFLALLCPLAASAQTPITVTVPANVSQLIAMQAYNVQTKQSAQTPDAFNPN